MKPAHGVMVQKVVPFGMNDFLKFTSTPPSEKLREVIAQSGVESLQELLRADGQNALKMKVMSYWNLR
jgi:hypothetical protein